MIKKGFTLAEVLITLGIIGVIASLTLPALNANVQKQQMGPALAKAVNTLENAGRMVLQDNNATKLSNVPDCKNGTNIKLFKGNSACLLKYINGAPLTAKEDYYSFDNKTEEYNPGSAVDSVDGDMAIVTKDGIAYYQADLQIDDDNPYIKLYLDLNGPSKKPNALGKDLFIVGITNKGVVIPIGGRADAAINDFSEPDWAGDGCNGSKVTRPDACAGAIADNGWQVKYEWYTK